MFYEESQINSSLNCKQCTKRLDKPNILPCGGIICTFCVLSKKMVNNMFDCQFCSQQHEYPTNGFPLCEPLVDLLAIKPNDMQRSESVRQLYELQKKIEAFKLGLNYGIKQIKDYCSELRSQVQLSTDTSIQTLYSLNKSLVDEIDVYERDLIKAFEKNKDERKDDYNKIISEIEKLTKQYELNENNVFNTIEIYQKLEEEKFKLDEIIFDSNYLKFVSNSNSELTSETCLGKLVHSDKRRNINI